jgi:hypothetical protein
VRETKSFENLDSTFWSILIEMRMRQEKRHALVFNATGLTLQRLHAKKYQCPDPCPSALKSLVHEAEASPKFHSFEGSTKLWTQI